MPTSFTKLGHFKTASAFRDYLQLSAIDLPVDDAVLSAADDSPLAKPIQIDHKQAGNRWCIHPMEGWDALPTGEPSDHTLRRWANFGKSGAKLIWGGEAFAVSDTARANPNQLAIVEQNVEKAQKSLAQLQAVVCQAHKDTTGRIDDLIVGLQLTHSGRFCKPFSHKEYRPRIAYHHPFLDKKFGISPENGNFILTDSELETIIDQYVIAAKLACKAGFDFVDLKHCHGYLGHELLSAFTRPGQFGGSFANRTRFLFLLVDRIQSEVPGLGIGVRLSVFDHPPFEKGPDGKGVVVDYQSQLPYWLGFGCNPHDPIQIDLTEPVQLINQLAQKGVRLINASCSSPYYNPHLIRPAAFPPSDGYLPPEDPLAGVARQIDVVRQLKKLCPDSILVGSGYSYLQEFLPNVAQAVVRQNGADFVGLGRMVLSYWDLPHDTLTGKPLAIKRLCRTFSDCTSAPRNGIKSGCYPLDGHYKDSPEHVELKRVKGQLKKEI